ncbi:hypothetical protein MTR_1g015900 [Medicago truncatula]|uniref:Uncharacterized protein n=1 Tax=Medicago truncatula TaxID=3880 RepID=G7I9W2_MEDTR|nr:hypothetical protein MTR_1g015900 [Medicago truncatula]
MVSEPLQDPLSHHLSGFLLVVRGCVKSPTSDGTWPDNVFISGGKSSPHKPVFKDELGLQFLRWYQSLSKIHWTTCYQVSAIEPPTIYVNEPSPIVLVVRGGVKSPTSDRTWHDNVFISRGNHHLTSRFYGIVLGTTTISKTLFP